jgi:hypothetical protein
VLKGLKRGTTFSIETFSNAMWILSENSEKLLGLNLIGIILGICKLGDIWTRDLYLHLVTNSIHGEEFGVQTRNSLMWI